MVTRRLPDLSPDKVLRLQDALLLNADTLLTSALAVLDLGHTSLARSLAILALEESGKAIAVHERRVNLGHSSDGEPFRCLWLDELWASHEKKLEIVHRFLAEERYWFGVDQPEIGENLAVLGSIKSWARRHDRSKQRGFYVDLGKTGEVLAPPDVSDVSALRDVIERVHQIGWQLRLGEHIEGKFQDAKEAGSPGRTDEEIAWYDAIPFPDGDRGAHDQLRQIMKDGVPGEKLPNAAYRFNPPGEDRSPFRNVGKPGHEAEDRELWHLANPQEED